MTDNDAIWIKEAISALDKKIEKFLDKHDKEIDSIYLSLKNNSDRIIIIETKLATLSEAKKDNTTKWIGIASIIIALIAVAIAYLTGVK